VLHRLDDIAIPPTPFDAESGETHYRQARALVEPRGMRPLVAHRHLGLFGMERSLRSAEEDLATVI